MEQVTQRVVRVSYYMLLLYYAPVEHNDTGGSQLARIAIPKFEPIIDALQLERLSFSDPV